MSRDYNPYYVAPSAPEWRDDLEVPPADAYVSTAAVPPASSDSLLADYDKVVAPSETAEAREPERSRAHSISARPQRAREQDQLRRNLERRQQREQPNRGCGSSLYDSFASIFGFTSAVLEDADPELLAASSEGSSATTVALGNTSED